MGALVPDCRLAPEHPFPAALDDALRAYRHLVDSAEGPLVVAGDSSGASLVLGVLPRARAEGLPLPFTMTRAFQMFWIFLPEALASAGRFIKGGENSEAAPL